MKEKLVKQVDLQWIPKLPPSGLNREIWLPL